MTASKPTQAERIEKLEGSVTYLKGENTKRGKVIAAQNVVITEQRKALADQAARVNALETDMKKIIDFLWRPAKPAPTPPAPPKPPAPAPKPPAPVPSPVPPAPTPPAPSSRSREDVIRIVLEEFGKQTTFVPGGENPTAPDKAIGLWATNLIDNFGALTTPEPALRALLADMVRAELDRFPQWERKPAPAFGGPVISGEAQLPAK